MSETTEKKVTFMDSVQLFDEMVIEKYFKDDKDTEDVLFVVAGNAEFSQLHVAVGGNVRHIVTAINGACSDEKIRAIIMRVAANLSLDLLKEKLNRELDAREEEGEEDDD